MFAEINYHKSFYCAMIYFLSDLILSHANLNNQCFIPKWRLLKINPSALKKILKKLDKRD